MTDGVPNAVVESSSAVATADSDRVPPSHEAVDDNMDYASGDTLPRQGVCLSRGQYRGAGHYGVPELRRCSGTAAVGFGCGLGQPRNQCNSFLPVSSYQSRSCVIVLWASSRSSFLYATTMSST